MELKTETDKIEKEELKVIEEKETASEPCISTNTETENKEFGNFRIWEVVKVWIVGNGDGGDDLKHQTESEGMIEHN